MSPFTHGYAHNIHMGACMHMPRHAPIYVQCTDTNAHTPEQADMVNIAGAQIFKWYTVSYTIWLFCGSWNLVFFFCSYYSSIYLELLLHCLAAKSSVWANRSETFWREFTLTMETNNVTHIVINVEYFIKKCPLDIIDTVPIIANLYQMI